jgi:hypothetical protein
MAKGEAEPARQSPWRYIRCEHLRSIRPDHASNEFSHRCRMTPNPVVKSFYALLGETDSEKCTPGVPA